MTSDLALDHTTETTKWEKLMKSRGLSVLTSQHPWTDSDMGSLNLGPQVTLGLSVTFQSLPVPKQASGQTEHTLFLQVHS